MFTIFRRFVFFKYRDFKYRDFKQIWEFSLTSCRHTSKRVWWDLIRSNNVTLFWLLSTPRDEELYIYIHTHISFPSDEHLQWGNTRKGCSDYSTIKYKNIICPATNCIKHRWLISKTFTLILTSLVTRIHISWPGEWSWTWQKGTIWILFSPKVWMNVN